MGNLQTTRAAEEAAGSRRLKLQLDAGIRVELTRLAALLLLCLVLAVVSPYFTVLQNLRNVLLQASLLALIAFGMTFALLVEGIDLSVGSVIALAGVVAASLVVKGHILVGALGGIAVGAACGLFNGALIGYLRIPPVIATYGMLFIARGLALSYTGGFAIYSFDMRFRWIATGLVLGIPVPILIAVAMAAALTFVSRRTILGKHIYAVGSNRVAARYTGVNIPFTLLVVYLLSGALSGFAALIYIARLNAAEPIIGELFALDAIAATVIGGTSFSGGEGGPRGTVIGALIIAVIRNGLNLLKVSSQWQIFCIGAIVLTAVTLDLAAKRYAEVKK
jgi:ribose transport system permease protein